jgi:hypothetical protein
MLADWKDGKQGAGSKRFFLPFVKAPRSRRYDGRDTDGFILDQMAGYGCLTAGHYLVDSFFKQCFSLSVDDYGTFIFKTKI